MANKVFWFDLETTGTNSSRCAITQLACLVEIDYQIVDSLNIFISPHARATLEDDALEYNDWPNDPNPITPAKAYTVLTKLLTKYCNRYDKKDKFVLAGYNINAFDEPFLRNFFKRQKDKYFGSWFYWPKRDVQTYVAEHIAENFLSTHLKNFKLGTLCKHFQIPIDAHDALSDIQATRTLYHMLRYSIAASLAA